MYTAIYKLFRERYKWAPWEFDAIDLKRINIMYREVLKIIEKETPDPNKDER